MRTSGFPRCASCHYSPPLAEGQKWMYRDGENECLLNVFTVCPSARVCVKHEHFWSDQTTNTYVGFCCNIKSKIRSGFALTSKAIHPDVSWLGIYIFKDAICGRHRGVFVHITANLVWLLGSPADIWVVFTPCALDEVGILKSVHHSQDDHVFIFLLCATVCVCVYFQVQQSSLCVSG